jgi:ABC-2 type transport system ATP-binding protein
VPTPRTSARACGCAWWTNWTTCAIQPRWPLNTILRTIGRPAELRDQLFAKTLAVRTLFPLPDPAGVFAGLPAVDGWHPDGPASYVLAVSDPAVAAPAATRALVAASADVLSISESRHSLEDFYLELIDQDQEASRR